MADYRPLVERLVASLPERGLETRMSAYHRLRQALESQFGGSEGDERLLAERHALAEAIAHVEAELSVDGKLGIRPPSACLDPGGGPAAALSQASSVSGEAQGGDGIREAEASGAPPARRSSSVAKLTMSVCAVCTLLIGAGAIGWGLSQRPGQATVVPEGDAEEISETSGAAVPDPVRQVGSSETGGASSLVMQRAALLIDAPEQPARVKVYAGHVRWRLMHPGSVQDRAAPAQVKADVDIAEAGLKVEIVFDKNTAPQLPASHTAQVRFIRQPDSPIVEVNRIGLPEMRDADAPTGDRLAGSEAKVTDGVFLIGFSGSDHEAANLRLIRSRPWIDIPVLLQGRRVAKVTFEKGAAGDAVWAEALAEWGGKPARDPRVTINAPAQDR